MNRRSAFQMLAGAAAIGAPAWVRAAPARVVVVGGGYGGATAAKALRAGSNGRLDVTLVEPLPAFFSCPLSNLVLTGRRRFAELTRPYDPLVAEHGVQVVRDRVLAIDPPARRARLASGSSLAYDRLLLAPGVELMDDAIDGLAEARRSGRLLAAWTAGDEIVGLRRQLEALPEGGVVAIAVPEMPYRCPPAPYERASLVAAWMERARPRAKVLVLDANDDLTSQAALFRAAWKERFGARLEYRPQHKVTEVDAASGTLRFEFQDALRVDVANILPPMRAGRVAVDSGLASVNGRWCGVDFLDFRSTVAEGVHVVGDAIQGAALMPKSGQMAHSHAKVAAAAIVAELAGAGPDPAPTLTSACYSFVDEARAIHLASVHRYDPAGRTYEAVREAGSASSAPSEADAERAWAWGQAIWREMLG